MRIPAFVIAATLPASAMAQVVLPAGHHVIAEARMKTASPERSFRIVAMGRDGESRETLNGTEAQLRPLLIIEEKPGSSRIVGRNDHVVMRADEAAQCDPFDADDGSGIAVKDRYFTIENGVSCGQHWTINITFRLDDRLGFVFSTTRTETWEMNPDTRPDAPALIRDTPLRVVRANPRKPVRFADWRPDPEN